ncbi:putative uncharacterized protein [Bacteroides sp. CAG:144]|nr:putative uncharacterized protein [Bacteroides sp. CAG:144]
MRVVLVAYRDHLYHVLPADGFVPAFVKEDTRVVACIDDDVAHQFFTLFPTPSLHIFFGISGRKHLYDTDPVAGLDILFLRGDVHPAEKVGIVFDHQSVGIVAQPGRNRYAHARPFVARALRIAFELYDTVIEPYFPASESGLAESGCRNDFIDGFIIDDETGYDMIEITISPAPKMDILQWGRGFQHCGFLRIYGYGRTRERAYPLAFVVIYVYFIADGHRFVVLITDLGFGVYHRFPAFYFYIGGIYIDSGSLQVAV